jgi:hypothetical protein
MCSSETSVEFQWTLWRYIPEGTLHNHCCENLRSYIAFNVSLLGCFNTVVQMKGIQNKIIISQKAFIIHIPGSHHYKGKLSKFFF